MENENKKKSCKYTPQSVFLAVIVCLVTIVMVSSISIQLKSVDEYKDANIEGLREDELKKQIASYKEKYEEAQAKYEENQNKIVEYKATETKNEEAEKLLNKELEQTRMLLGLTDVKGNGVTITLKDTFEQQYSSENLRYLVNELKYAGAEAISINDNRIINTTDIVTINNSFIVLDSGRTRIASPYVIKAIGDPKYLLSTLNMKNSGFVDLMESMGLKVTVEQTNDIVIKKYDGEYKYNYLTENEEEE
jgi:uncharacterized protein YlxW (UPF0749 family)